MWASSVSAWPPYALVDHARVVKMRVVRLSWQEEVWWGTREVALKTAIGLLRHDPKAWPDDVVVDAGMRLVPDRPQGVALLSVVEVSILLNNYDDGDLLLQEFAPRLEELKSARVIAAVCSNRQQRKVESSGWHFFGVVFDLREGLLTAYYAESLSNSTTAQQITGKLLHLLGFLLGVEEEQQHLRPFCVPLQTDGWSCAWRSMMAVDHGARGLVEKGRVPGLSVMEELLTEKAVVDFREAVLEGISKV